MSLTAGQKARDDLYTQPVNNKFVEERLRIVELRLREGTTCVQVLHRSRGAGVQELQPY